MSDIRLLRPATGPLSDTFAEHAARYPARVARGDYAYCGQDFAWHTIADCPIRASNDGIADVRVDRDYGRHVVIPSPGFETLSAHLDEVYVQAGQYVTAGTLIGLMGSTGNAKGRHLHHELRVGGVQIDPLPHYLSAAEWAAAMTPIELPNPHREDPDMMQGYIEAPSGKPEERTFVLFGPGFYWEYKDTYPKRTKATQALKQISGADDASSILLTRAEADELKAAAHGQLIP